MQTQRHAAAPLIEPPAAPAAGECRRLRIVARIESPDLWDSTAARLLECARRRWQGRPDIADHPALRRWSQIQDSQQRPEQPCLRTLFAAFASGSLVGGDPCADLVAAVMLLSSCPAEAVQQPDPLGDQHTVRFSVYAYREDDLPLAEDMIITAVKTCGTLLAHRCTIMRPPARSTAPLVDHPTPDRLVLGNLGSTAAR
ncbi:hypothetical protein QX204_19015 [Nocardia sp. PE-7]|uniref:hypothetical protein n=1 Tax=Nocardia sp. PE-7 TaxID=3058426 RepID=UPI00265B1F07|nr:hypothetical protein [Nocardia sp. PE-7]WKG07203.1 hypothetical protein QX204_19015 [Nocardia sp. PE-7]